MLGLVLSAVVLLIWLAVRTAAARDKFVDAYRFPPQLRRAVERRYAHLRPTQLDEVLEQLRTYFHLCRRAKGPLAMPSQAVDVAWHEFILSTRQYQQFCQRAFGRYLHHTPAEAMPAPTEASARLRRCWHLACRRAGIDPRAARELPPLFALDARLAIPDGFHFVPDCGRTRAAEGATVIYCGSHLGCSGGGDGDGGTGGGDGGGDGGGCSGGGGD
jgi:hypothetical protein